jgi:cbb3-type cytochrome c oxidase subunit III
MKRNKYLLLISSVGVLLLLFVAAADEHFFKDWRSIQSEAKTQEGALDVRLRQVVNPKLKVSDRCVSCHVGMAAGEQVTGDSKVLAAHKPVVHSPAEFGCTTCHGGQGRATEKDDAHGDVHFWPQPMIPAKYSQAGCGTCHAPLNVPNLVTLEKGRGAFERLDCIACHRVDGRGGTLRPGGGGMEGPDISYVGIKGYDSSWYDKHFKKYEEAKEGIWKTSFGKINEQDIESLRSFLSTRVGAPKLVEAKAQFNSQGCYGCHKVSGVGGDAGVDLSRSGEKDPGQLDFANVHGNHTLDNWFAQHFRSPVSTVPGSLMPILGLNDNQIDLLTMYTLSLRRRELPSTYLPKDRVQATRFGAREFSSDGATIFSAFCSACHGANGQGMRYPGFQPYPAIANPDFLELASDEFITATVRSGRPNRQMLAWGEKDGGLKADEIKAVVAYLRQMSGVQYKQDTSPPRWVKGDWNVGKKIYTAYCVGCHGQKGEGAEGPALNNKVLLSSATDTFLVETISRGRRGTAMQSFANSSPIRPALTRWEIESVVTFIRSLEAK